MPTPIENNTETIRTIIDQVNSLPDQVVLPTLSNPATQKNIQEGYEAIGPDGQMINGELTAFDLLPVIHTPAFEANIQEGYEAIGSHGDVIQGTLKLTDLLPTVPNQASEANIQEGFAAVGTDGNVIQGTLKAADLLPTLSNPATSYNIQEGYEAIGSDGYVMQGSLTLANLLPQLSSPAASENIQEGYEAIGPDGNVITGTAVMQTAGSQVFNITDNTGCSFPASAEAGERVNTFIGLTRPDRSFEIKDPSGREIPYSLPKEGADTYVLFIMPASDVTITIIEVDGGDVEL